MTGKATPFQEMLPLFVAGTLKTSPALGPSVKQVTK
jgi:hypothetical protein